MREREPPIGLSNRDWLFVVIWTVLCSAAIRHVAKRDFEEIAARVCTLIDDDESGQ